MVQTNQWPSGPSNLNPYESSFLYSHCTNCKWVFCFFYADTIWEVSVCNSNFIDICHFLQLHLLLVLWLTESAVAISQMPSIHQPKAYWNYELWKGHAVVTTALTSCFWGASNSLVPTCNLYTSHPLCLQCPHTSVPPIALLPGGL